MVRLFNLVPFLVVTTQCMASSEEVIFTCDSEANAVCTRLESYFQDENFETSELREIVFVEISPSPNFTGFLKWSDREGTWSQGSELSLRVSDTDANDAAFERYAASLIKISKLPI